LISNDKSCIHGHFYDTTVSKMAANKIGKLSMVSDFNENWYLGVFWSQELFGNDEICIHGHFHEATIFKMAANKIVKLSMVSDFNENWYLEVFWSEKLVGNDETCIHMPEFWYGGRLGTSVFASKHNQTSPKVSKLLDINLLFLHRFLLLLFFLFFSPWTCPTKFSETDDPIFTKLHRKVDPHIKRCIQVLEFSKWPPLPWKLWTYVKIFDLFDLTCIGNKPPKGFPQNLAYILRRVGGIFWSK